MSGSGPAVELVRSLADLDQYAAGWDAMVAAMPLPLPLESHAWVASFLQHRLGPDDRWCCLLAHQGSELVGVLPLVVSPHKALGVSRTLLGAPRDPHTRSVGPVIVPGYEAAVMQAFMAALPRVDSGWHALLLDQIPTPSPVTAFLTAGRRSSRCRRLASNPGAYLPTVGDFTAYRAALKKGFRTNLTTATNRLGRYPDVRTEFLVGADAVAADLERFMAVEVKSWKGQEGSAIVQSPDLVEFYTTLARRLQNRGWLEWHFLLAEDKTIAGNLMIRCGRSLVLWKLGYDDQYAKCSPGTILFEKEVAYAFASDDIDRIDLITSPRWARNWKMETRDYQSIWAYRPGLLPLVADILPDRITNAGRRIPVVRRSVQRVRDLLNRS